MPSGSAPVRSGPCGGEPNTSARTSDLRTQESHEMDFTKQIEGNRRALIADISRRIERAAEPFGFALDWFLADLFRGRLPADWRERWHAFVDEQAEHGFFVEPTSVRELEAWIEAWARYCGLLPVENHRPVRELGGQWLAMRDAPTANTAPSSGVHVVLAAGPPNAGGPPRGRLPRSDGNWDGARGTSVWRPNHPIKLKNGITITKVPYRDGMPVFDEWSKGDVKIAITGEPGFDRSNALRAWQANGGGKLPDDYVFHHDGLTTETIRYKGRDVLVGRMQLVPAGLNRRVPHIGSAAAARFFAGKDKRELKRLAKEINEMALKGIGPLTKVAKRFKSLLAKGAKRIGRIVPLVGGVLVILDFTEDAEAHGIGGALIRSTPLLGDVVTLYDVASDLADEIKSGADQEFQDNLERINKTSREAHRAAASVTLQVFNDIARRVHVTNPYFDAQALRKPIENYYETVRALLFLRLENRPIRYPAGMESDKKATESPFNVKLRMVREALERAIQEQVSPPPETREGSAT